MAKFTCKECGNEQESGWQFAPQSCNNCKKRGNIWLEGASDATAPKGTESSRNTSGSKDKVDKAGQPDWISKASETKKPVVKDQSKTAPTGKLEQSTAVGARMQEVKTLSSQGSTVLGAGKPNANVNPSRVVWRTPPRDQKNLRQKSCFAYDAGRAYLCLGADLVAYDTRESRLVPAWSFSLGIASNATPVVGPDGNVIVHAENGYLHSLDRNGKVLRSILVGRPLGYSTPVVDCNRNVWISAAEGGLYKISPEKQDFETYVKTRHYLDCSGIVVGSSLFIGCEHSCVFKVDLSQSSGQNLWNPFADQGRTGWYVNAGVARGKYSAIVVASGQSEVVAFDQDGYVKWKNQLVGDIHASPVICSKGHVYLGISRVGDGGEVSGEFFCLDGQSGTIRWRILTADGIEATSVIGNDDTIFFADTSGVVYALDSQGHKLWSERIDTGVRSAGTLLPGGLLVFGTENGGFVGLKSDCNGICESGWPKYLGHLSNNALAEN